MVQTNCIKNKIIIICGPTASSKTALSVELAKLLDTEIISADSMNVYRGLDVGTAKPNEEEKQGIRHHLIDVVTPEKTFSVGDYRELALPIVERLQAKGKIPIICGGTGFYINSILYDFSYGNTTANLDAREKYMKMAKEHGNSAVYEVLKAVDSKTAEKLHENDLKRVVRALEIYESGALKSEIVDDLTPKYNYDAFCIDFDRETLYNRINLRVDLMVKNGLIDEVRRLIDCGITREHQCMQGIGYKEIASYLLNEIDLQTAIEQVKQNTRRYAKRQITFFKKLPNLTYLKPDNPCELAQKIYKTVKENDR